MKKPTLNEGLSGACLCAFKGCTKEGAFRAPHSLHHPLPYRYYCLEHIREHNAKWNAFSGLNAGEIEEKIRAATVWERPTWPFGKGPLAHKKGAATALDQTPPEKVLRALALFNLTPPITLSAIKARHRALIKQCHPDANQGSRAKIDSFYAIQQAFGTLRLYYARKRKEPKNTTKE